jgi:F-type H+-transporting ATPase subunit gamma
MAQRKLATLIAAVAVGAACAVLSACFQQLSFVGNSKAVPVSVGLAPGSVVSQRPAGTSLNAVDILLKQRINAVKKTSKVTDAMRLIAASKVRKAQDGVEQTRPFSMELQGMIKGLVKKLKGTGLEAELPMLRVAENVKTIAIVAVTSTRGLCGAYNAFVMKKLARRVKALNEQGVTPKVLFIGKKGRKMAGRRLDGTDYQEITEYLFDMPDNLDAAFSNSIGEAISNIFLAGEVDKVEILYSKFVNLLKNIPTVRTLLPLSPVGIEDPEDETFTLTSVDGKLSVNKKKADKVAAKEIENDVIFDQPPEAILNSMLPLYLNSVILNLLYEAQASELGSRMVAMKAATDNAREVAKKLEVIYNRKRQAAITAEVAEICAGASAVDEMLGKGNVKDLSVFDSDESITEEFMNEIEAGDTPEVPQFAWDKYPREYWEDINEVAPMKGAKF